MAERKFLSNNFNCILIMLIPISNFFSSYVRIQNVGNSFAVYNTVFNDFILGKMYREDKQCSYTSKASLDIR